MAATLVKRQFSCCGVGKPSSSKHAKPTFRADDSNVGSSAFLLDNFDSVWFKLSSVTRFAKALFGLVSVIIIVVIWFDP
jgi:hypothetical protein